MGGPPGGVCSLDGASAGGVWAAGGGPEDRRAFRLADMAEAAWRTERLSLVRPASGGANFVSVLIYKAAHRAADQTV